MAKRIEVSKLATLTGHRDCVYALEKGVKSNLFFSAGGDGMVAVWDLENPEIGELVANVSSSVYSLCLLEDKNLLMIGQNMQAVQIVDLEEKRIHKTIAMPPFPIFALLYVQSKELVYAGLGDGSLIQINSLDFSFKKVKKISDKSLRSLTLNTEKNEIAAGFSDNIIRILDGDTLEIKQEIEGHNGSVFSVLYSMNGRFLMSGSRDAHLKIWDVSDNYREYDSIIAHMFTINDLALSPDGRYFATCSMDKTIKIWDAASFKLLKVIDRPRNAGHATSINKLFWTGHDNQLVSCSDDRTISIWDLKF